MSIPFNREDLTSPDRIERVLRLFERAILNASSTAKPIEPIIDITALAQDIRRELQIGGSAPLNLQSLLPISTTGVINPAVTPSSVAGNVVIFADTTGIAISDSGLMIAAGVYTPTRSNEVNLDSNVTFSEAQYLRVGTTVTVSGRFTADPTAAGAASFEGTLPIASNIGAAEDVAGIAFSGVVAGQGAEIVGVAANDHFKVQWIAVDLTSQTWSYTFTYQII